MNLRQKVTTNIRGQEWRKAKARGFEKNLFVSFPLLWASDRVYAIYNLSTFFISFNDGWHEQEWIWIEIQMSVAAVISKFRFRAVSYLSWLDGGCHGWEFLELWDLWDLWEFLELWELLEVVALLISFLSHQRLSPPRAIHDCQYINGRIQWSPLFT